MILVDYNNVAFASLSKQVELTSEASADILLRKLKMINMKFRDQYGELVLCSDAGAPWRLEYFEHYKARRRANKEAKRQQAIEDRLAGNDVQPGTKVVENVSNFVNIFRRHACPYRIVQVQGAEADDCIAVLALNNPGEYHLIVSADKDLSQLRSPNIDIWNPIKHSFVNNGNSFGKTLTIYGDAGDDVPNVLSEGDTFITGKRQKSITAKRFDILMQNNPIKAANLLGIDSDFLHLRWEQNAKIVLLDLEAIPISIQKSIMDSYNNQAINNANFVKLLTELHCSHMLQYGSDFLPAKKQTSLDLM